MTISTFDQWVAGAKQMIHLHGLSSGLNGVNYTGWASSYDTLNIPGPSALNSIGNTANGVVPTDATAGFPPIYFSSGTGYLSLVRAPGNNPGGPFIIYDRLFHAGAYAFNANVTLTAQPSYSGRVPNSDYSGTMLLMEAATAFVTTRPTLTVTYTDQSGNTAHTTGANLMFSVLPQGGCVAIVPLAAGDSGVQKVESVVCTGPTAGTFNIVVARPLFQGCWRVTTGGGVGNSLASTGGDSFGFEDTGLPIVYGDSCLAVLTYQGSTASSIGGGNMLIGIVSG